MHAEGLIPAVDPIPVAAAWMDPMLIGTFVVHILLMNVLLGGVFIALARRFAGADDGLDRALSKRAPIVMALAVNFGVAPFLFLQTLYGQFDYTSSVLMGGLWLFVIAALLLAYSGLYWHELRFEKLGGLRTGVLAGVLVLLLYTAFMFTNNMTLMLNTDGWLQYFRTPESDAFLNLADPTVFPRWLHFMTAAVAVAGLYIAVLGRSQKRADWTESGMKWFTRATMLNVVLGLAFLVSLPEAVQHGFLGGRFNPTTQLLAAAALAVLAIFCGARRKVGLCVGLLLPLVVVMALARDQVRVLALEPHFTIGQLPVTNQPGPMWMFLLTLAAGLACCAWLAKLWLDASESSGESGEGR